MILTCTWPLPLAEYSAAEVEGHAWLSVKVTQWPEIETY